MWPARKRAGLRMSAPCRSAGRRGLAPVALLALLSAGWSLPAAASRGAAPDVGALEVYARARLAEADGNLAVATGAYARALTLAPDSAEVSRRSYRLAVLAGDKALALRAAHRLDAAGTLPRDGTVLLLIDALDRGQHDRAVLLTDRIESEGNLAFLAPFLRSWIALSGGAYTPPEGAADKPYTSFVQRYRPEQELLLALAQGNRVGAAGAYADFARRGVAFGAQERAVLAARLARLDEPELARAVLASGPDGGAEDTDPARWAKDRRLPELTPQYGLSTLLARVAQDLFAQEETVPTFSIARMAAFAAPGNDDARLTAARAALNAGYADQAYAGAGAVPATSPAWFDAQVGQVRALIELDRYDDAVARAQELVRRPGPALRAWRLLGDVRMRGGDFAAASQAYAQARAEMGDREDPSLLLQLGGALEQAGQWTEAQPLLRRVVELAPDSAAALNHLGYALADRGQDLPQAIALLEKANRIRPSVPAYVDSLGWAFFRAGQPARALPLIEQAAAEDPGNGELSEHLGDILWAVGRRFEARYAWQAALGTLEEDAAAAAMRDRLRQKMDGRFAATDRR